VLRDQIGKKPQKGQKQHQLTSNQRTLAPPPLPLALQLLLNCCPFNCCPCRNIQLLHRCRSPVLLPATVLHDRMGEATNKGQQKQQQQQQQRTLAPPPLPLAFPSLPLTPMWPPMLLLMEAAGAAASTASSLSAMSQYMSSVLS
jgi:hypothetical protein